MCGRFLIHEDSFFQAASIAQIPAWIQGELHFGDIYPSMPALVLVQKPGTMDLEGEIRTFGYSYERNGKKQQVINARSETAAEKWMFKKAFKQNRAVVVCSRFYEWDPEKQKVSFFEPGQTLYLGALILDDGFVILTKEANPSVSPWHHRMPVIFDAVQAKTWILEPQLSQVLIEQASPALDHHLFSRQEKLFPA